MAVFDVDGNHQWSRRFGDAEAQRGHGIAFTSNGDVVVSGYNNGTLDNRGRLENHGTLNNNESGTLDNKGGGIRITTAS